MSSRISKHAHNPFFEDTFFGVVKNQCEIFPPFQASSCFELAAWLRAAGGLGERELPGPQLELLRPGGLPADGPTAGADQAGARA